MIYLQLFLSFLQVGLFSVGGGYAAIPLIQSQVVTTHSWLTTAEFIDLTTIAEMTPGPIAINAATFVGIRVAGLSGAIIATLGSITPALFLVSLLAKLYLRYQKLDTMQRILGSLRPALVALIAGAGLTILLTVLFGGASPAWASLSLSGAALFLGAFFVLRKFKWNPIAVMSLCGLLGLVIGLIQDFL